MLTRIASIHFASVRAERPFGGPYEIPAVPIGAQVHIIPISDRIQIEQGPYSLGSNGRRQRRQYVIPGETIARDIVQEWTANGVGMNPQCRPGIWVVRDVCPLLDADGTMQRDADNVAQWRPATDIEREQAWVEDLAAAKLADVAYAQMLFTSANAQADDPRLVPFIPKIARLGARHYGFESDWLKDNAPIAVKSCPYCTKIIPSAAIKCPKCTEIVDVVAYAAQEVQRKAAMAAATKELARLEREAAPV